jgi:serine/threonine protein kinase
MNINNLEIKNKLGSGMYGTVFLAEYNNKEYALKIEHILESDKKKSLKSTVWREIEFYNRLAKKYPNNFMRLYAYDFVDNCEHEQDYSYDLKSFDKDRQTQFKKLAKSNYCVRKVYSKIDSTLDQIISDLNKKQLISLVIQYLYIVYLLEKNGYIHGDLHPNNIGLIKTDQQYIKIFDTNVPTYGYIYQAIDYGSILNKKFKLNPEEKNYYKKIFRNEWFGLIHFQIIVKEPFMKNKDLNKQIKLFKKTRANEIFKEYSDNIYHRFLLYRLLSPTKHQQLIMGNKYVITEYPEILIPIEDIIFMVKTSKTSRILEYFLDKI